MDSQDYCSSLSAVFAVMGFSSFFLFGVCSLYFAMDLLSTFHDYEALSTVSSFFSLSLPVKKLWFLVSFLNYLLVLFDLLM